MKTAYQNLKDLLQDYCNECDNAKISPQFFMEYVCNERYTNIADASIKLGYVTTGELRRHIQQLQSALPN